MNRESPPPPPRDSPAKILAVEDNPTTRAFVRLTLEDAGYTVLAAPDGRTALEIAAREPPDLVLLDLVLSDMSGLEVAEKIRLMLAGRPVVIVAFTGEVPAQRGLHSLIDHILLKPADQSELLQAVAAHLDAPDRPAQPAGGRLLLLAVGEAMRDALALRFRRLGFEVTAVDPREAPGRARAARPDIVVADALAPGLSGFELCLALRREASLAALPVVLVSHLRNEDDDLQAARRVGASALAGVSPGLREVEDAVLRSLDSPPPSVDFTISSAQEHLSYLQRQLHRGHRTNVEAVRIARARALQYGMLERLAGLVAETRDLDGILSATLSEILHIFGGSRGAIYVKEADGLLAIRARAGDPWGNRVGPIETDAPLSRVMEKGESLILDTRPPSEGAGQPPWLAVVPLSAGEEPLGALVVASSRGDLRPSPSFLEAIGLHLGLAIRLTRTAERLAASERRALHDSLTGLPNNMLLAGRLAEVLSEARTQSGTGALILIGLDRFWHANGMLGQRAGDAVLKEIARRIDGVLDASHFLARVGGARFAVLVPSIGSVADAVVLGQRLLDAVSEPLRHGDRVLHLTASIGVAVFPEAGHEASALLQRAVVAMRRAKEGGGNSAQIYRPEWEAEAGERLALEHDLRAALVDAGSNGLALFYQPRIRLASGEIEGAEALLRWRHPSLGLLLPGKFIPLAEETGLIVPMGELVLRDACSRAKTWPGIRVSVNVAARQFFDGDLPAVVKQILDHEAQTPEFLELEVTESLAMRDLDHAARMLGRIRDLGVGISLDDFGTGYSSLAYLRRLPIDAIKIDRSFVADLTGRERNNAAIVAAVIDLAHSLDVAAVAEGVETEEQLELLVRQGCDEAQGYFLGKPMPPEDFEKVLTGAARTARPDSLSPSTRRQTA